MQKCSLVCRAWTPLVHRHLYAEMALTPKQQSLVLVLHQAPHLLGYVRRLRIDYPRRFRDYDVAWSGDEQDATEAKGMVPAQLLPVVRAMVHVTSIDIGRIDFGDHKRSPKYARSLTSLVSHFREELPLAASVRDVWMAYPHPDAIFACFAAFPGLEVLELEHRRSKNRLHWDRDVIEKPDIVLKELSFAMHSGVHACLLMLLSLPRTVERLRVVDIATTCREIYDWRRVNSLLDLCGGTLERLHVRCKSPGHAPDTYRQEAQCESSKLATYCLSTDNALHAVPLDWSALRCLRLVVVHVSVLRELPFIRNILKAAGQSPSRETLEEIQVQAPAGMNDARDLEVLRPSADWKRIDAAIAGLAAYPRFRRVTFLVRCAYVHWAEIGSGKVKARLPLSQAAGAVDFIFTESTGCGTAPGSMGRHRCEVIMSPGANSSTRVWL
jgi:hypothetical protein